MIYRGIIRANIDYGCMKYKLASESVLKKLGVLQAKALRICGGAMSTIPLNALLIEIGETTLELRWNKLSLYNWTKLRSYNSNPAGILLEEYWKFQRRDGSKRESRKNEFGKRAQEIGVNDIKIAPVVIWPPVPPWLLTVPKVDLSIFDQIKKVEGSPVDMVFNNLKRNWSGYIQLFTDGSMNSSCRKAAIGISIPQVFLRLFHWPWSGWRKMVRGKE